jgi:hypothetical protein
LQAIPLAVEPRVPHQHCWRPPRPFAAPASDGADTIAGKRAGNLYDDAFVLDGNSTPGIGGVCCNEGTDFMRHMTHALDVCGEDHVGIGTDLSVAALTDEDIACLVKYLEERRKKGIAAPGENRPLYIPDLNTPRRLERVADAPQKQGCGSRTVEKVLGPNFNRVYRDVWTV